MERRNSKFIFDVNDNNYGNKMKEVIFLINLSLIREVVLMKKYKMNVNRYV